ncbi:GNAT family N-acetyltransferase [Ramlibacter albus]|uniref:GNAT family N-acetyltransferase n=1 Tax=Ramlibacter albus TaxID=2079448 RepID=A0A923M9V9_9BURK|nr:GNAT family N-acetyltransferase [Ramlibacter albus]
MPQHAVTLRLARRADAPAIAELTRRHIEAGLAPRYSPARVARLIADRDTIALVADDTTGVQGFAIMAFGETRAHLQLLCVQPAQRRQGLARRMMDWLVESARVAGIASLHLELRADNETARAFYRRMGFEDTLVVSGYYEGRIDAVRMVRLLRRPYVG